MNADLVDGYQKISSPTLAVQCMLAGPKCTAFRILAMPGERGVPGASLVNVFFESIREALSRDHGFHDPLMLAGAEHEDGSITITGTLVRLDGLHRDVKKAILLAVQDVASTHLLSARSDVWITRTIDTASKLAGFVKRIDCGPEAQTYFNENANRLLEPSPDRCSIDGEATATH